MKTTINILFSSILFVFLLSCKDSDHDELKVKKIPISITLNINKSNDKDSKTVVFTYDENNHLIFADAYEGEGFKIIYDGDTPSKIQDIVDYTTIWNEYDIIRDGENVLSAERDGEKLFSCEYSSGALSKITRFDREYKFSWNDDNAITFENDEAGDYSDYIITYNYGTYIHPFANIDLPFALKFFITRYTMNSINIFDYLGYGKNIATSISINADFKLEVPETANFSIQTDDDGYPTYLISDDGDVIYEIHYKEI